MATQLQSDKVYAIIVEDYHQKGADMKHKILLLPENQILTAEHGARLLDVLTAHGILLPAACGGRGTCGKCKVTLLSGSVDGTAPDSEGQILSCRAHVTEDLTLKVSTLLSPTAITDKTGKAPLHAASANVLLDIGTTTLAWSAIDRETGDEIASGTALNPQGTCGADVLTRIKAWGEGKGELLQRLILDATEAILEKIQTGTGANFCQLIVVANPTMLHLFLGVDPSTIGVYPFTPVFKDEKQLCGADLSLPVESVTLLPSAHAYIGSDVTAGVLSTGIHTCGKTCLLVDIGTNGEIVLSHKGMLYATSCAAGPALEGASIECGMGGVSGAISHVHAGHGKLSLETVNGAPPIGICGSGLIDLIALLVREGLIDESGAWDENADSFLSANLAGDRFSLTDTVYLSQADIRQFQLAKAAIAAGIVTLLGEQGLTENDVDHVYLAGGLGFYMSIQNAIATGLLPTFPAERIQSVGNSALSGARLYLQSEAARRGIERIATETEMLELSFSPRFSEEYIERMSF